MYLMEIEKTVNSDDTEKQEVVLVVLTLQVPH